MSEKIYYKFLKIAEETNSIKENFKNPYKKDVSNPKTRTSKTKNNKKISVTSSKGEFHYYYEIPKQSGVNFLYIRYSNFKGETLEIENYEQSYWHIIFIVIGVILGVILIIVCICVGKYCYAQKQKAIMEENYKSSFVDEDNYNNYNNTVY